DMYRLEDIHCLEEHVIWRIPVVLTIGIVRSLRVARKIGIVPRIRVTWRLTTEEFLAYFVPPYLWEAVTGIQAVPPFLFPHQHLRLRLRGVVNCGLPTTSLSSPPGTTAADIMSVGDEGVLGALFDFLEALSSSEDRGSVLDRLRCVLADFFTVTLNGLYANEHFEVLCVKHRRLGSDREMGYTINKYLTKSHVICKLVITVIVLALWYQPRPLVMGTGSSDI
ncbi:hypothetical protein Tco_1395778, partial [Tanacetum coccineum]